MPRVPGGRAPPGSSPFPRLFQGRLRWRLLSWFVLFSLVPLIASNTLGYLRSRGMIERLIERQVEATAEIRARQVHGALLQQLRELRNLAAANEFMTAGVQLAGGRRAGPMGGVAGHDALEQHLVRKHEGLPGFDALFLLRADGGLVVHTGRADPAMRLPQHSPLTWSLLRGDGVFPRSDAVRPRSDAVRPRADAVRLRLLAPVRDENGLTVGYLGGLIGPRGFQLLFGASPHEPDGIESYLVDADGRPIHTGHAHPDLSFATPLAAPLFAADRTGRVAHYRDHGGRAVVGTIAAIPELGWYYLAEAPVGVVLAPLTRLRTLSIAFAAGLCLILALAAWIVAGGIVAPVRRLVAAARRVGAGDFSSRVREPQRDELGELAAAFNEMTAELERASARVRELHQREIERAGQLATVGELASSVAHEIKNPVAGMTGGLDLVRRRVGNDATLSPILDEMGRQLLRIEGAVRDLLAYARPASPRLTRIEIPELVERAARLVQLAAQRAGVELRLELPADLPAAAADPELITQAVVNLLLNAVQATAPGGCVTARVQRDGGVLRLAVEDTGRGIPADMLGDIFKPFFTTRHAGTGLGLPITRDVVERHGGRVEVSSALGLGSTFTILLPLTAAPAQTPVPA